MRRSIRFACLSMLLAGALAIVRPADARLGSDVVPTFQSVRLRVNADSADYRGSVRIELAVRKPTATVHLHADGQTLERVALTQKGKALAVKAEPGKAGLLTLTAAKPIALGSATLEIDFRTSLNTQAVGLYRVVKDGVAYTFSQFEAEDARKAFPCFDEPAFKFPYQLTLEIPAAHEGLFNTPLEKQEIRDGWKTLTFEKTPPTPSYLLAIATGPLEFTPVPGMKVPTRIVTVKGQGHLTAAAVKTTPPILAALEAWFGTPYPYAKLDLIAVPEYWAGAMENPGAITYKDDVLLADPRTASVAQRKNLLRITSHELAHMWFGDLVTMAWWDDLWLNESFADWLGDKVADAQAPEYRHLVSEVQKVQDIMRADARPSTEPIRLHAETGDDAMRAVGVAYYKGKAVLSMFEQWMGPEVFRQGVNDYIRAHAWKNAVPADLWSALGKASGKDVASVMGGFVEQPGLPLVTVERVEGGLRLSQRRFLNHGVQADPVSWQIPVTLSYSDGARTRAVSVLLGKEPKTVALETATPAWVLPNVGARGYYRWSLPTEMLMALAKAAPVALDPSERIGFAGNLVALLEAGEVRGDLYLRLLADLAHDPEPLVDVSVLEALDQARLALVPDDLRPAFAAYARRTLQPMSERFGLERKSGEGETVSLLRPKLMTLLGRFGNDPATLEFAATVANRHLEDPAAVDPAIAGVSLQLRALRGDRALFDRYRSALEAATNPTIRQRYLVALGAFADPAIEEAALQYVLDGPLRPNETFAIPGTIAQGSEAKADRIFAWTRAHYDPLAARLPESFRPFLAGGGGGCSAERYAIAREFFGDPARNVHGMERQLAKVGDQVRDCVGLRAREGAAVAAYLRGLLGAK